MPRVAIVHDYLREYGGAERVVEALHDIFPEAPIYTTYLNLKGLGKHQERIKNWDIKTSWVQYLPGANLLLSYIKFLAPKIFESMDLSQYDVVISSCNVYFSKAVKVGPRTLHISYIHTPPRYLYGYETTIDSKNFLLKALAQIGHHYLRIKDFEVSQKPDVLVANSKNVAERIKKFYRREAVVIYPPINTQKFKEAVTPGEGGYFLSVSRLVKGKGVEEIVRVCSELNLPLKVVGSGPLLSELKSQAGKTVEFLGQVKDQDLAGVYASAGALILNSKDEDFGITPVESMAAGTPIVALKSGGYLETVVDGKTGKFFEDLDELKKILKEFDPTKYLLKDLQTQADKFSFDVFKKSIWGLINKNLKS